MIVAGFANQGRLLAAAAALRSEPGAAVETYTAEEPAVAEDAPDTSRSRIPLVMVGAFVAVGAGMFGMQAYATTLGYPIGIGGRPDFAWPSFIPNAFEMAVMFAVLAGFGAFLAANRMPRLYDAVDESALVRGAMRGGNVLVLRGVEAARGRGLLAELGALAVEVPE